MADLPTQLPPRMADQFKFPENDASFVTSLSLNDAFVKLSDLAASLGVKLTAIQLEAGRLELTFADLTKKEISLASPAAGVVPSSKPIIHDIITGEAMAQSPPIPLSDLARDVLKAAAASMPPSLSAEQEQRLQEEREASWESALNRNPITPQPG